MKSLVKLLYFLATALAMPELLSATTSPFTHHPSLPVRACREINSHESRFVTSGADAHHKLRTVNFEVVRGIVIVEAELNGAIGKFILDTGSPMMILNEQVQASSEAQANTFQGALHGEWKTCDLSWAGIRRFNLNALAMDISHLEAATGQPLSGLIGYDFFEDFDLMLDFEKKEATLVPPGYVQDQTGWKLKAVVPFTIEGHLAVIEAKIGEATFRFGLDTGAGANLLDLSRKKEILPELLAPLRNPQVIGLGQQSQNYVAADVLETTIGGINYWSMRFVFTDISGMENLVANEVDGLLGFPFFEAGRFSINYRRKEMSIWE